MTALKVSLLAARRADDRGAGLLFVALVAALGLMPLAGCNSAKTSTTTPQASAGSWPEFNPEEGKFKIRMPGEPKELDSRQLGEINAGRGWECQDGPILYRVSYRDLATSQQNLDQDQIERQFDSFGDTISIVEKIKKIRDVKKSISFANTGGRELDIALPDKQAERIRLCIAGGRMYRVDLIGPEDDLDNVSSQMFFNSFQIGR